jgi:hypothetical protein
MLSPARSGPRLCALLAAGLIASNSHAGGPGGPSGVPLTPRAELAVVETGQGFSIQPATVGTPRSPARPAGTAAMLALGANLKLDRSIFASAAHSRPESTDAQNR